VTTVEIREITPPRDVQDAMNRQLSAERTRRAVITESEGARQSAINVAEGEKQATILRAEGDRQSAILRAEGFALALERIYQAAAQVDQKTMALQYLEAFKALGASPATKYVLPLEMTQLADAFRTYLSLSNEGGPSGGGAGSAPTIEPGAPGPPPTSTPEAR
jgi:regulator of protease activity HflC (stomatin/prohibitin superfamily)